MDQELADLSALLAQMGGRAEEMVRKAMAALRTRNALLASELRADDLEVDRLELAIEERCLTLLALRQPIATDLRLVTAALHVATDLERVGDHAINVGRTVTELTRLPNTVSMPPELDRLAGAATGMLQRALDAFTARDSSSARSVCADDDEADALEDETLRILQERMISEPASVPMCVQLLLVARNLERIADLATNVAEEAIFVAQARVIKHHHEDPV
ncbi:MAG: phosphate signaling complex protein PhoU [Candidatus Eisenbacteria bacterium]|nr:phosphate signaling complex protein PhoU [Candidatus Eisenbacteria bacterium]